jgi:hypothetical protein
MPELGPYGSVRGARGNSRPYRELTADIPKTTRLTHNGPHSTLSNVRVAVMVCPVRENVSGAVVIVRFVPLISK